MTEQNDDSRDRIDPVSGVRTGEISDAGSGGVASGENPVMLVLNRIASVYNTGLNIGLIVAFGIVLLFLPSVGSELAPNSSLFSEIIPTMILAWILLAFCIVMSVSIRRFAGFLYKVVEPIIVPGKGQKRDKKPFSASDMASDWYKSFQSRWLAAPNNISMAVSSACFQWRDFQAAATLAIHVAETALADQWPDNLLLNLNVPPCKQEAMGKLSWTRLSIRRYDEQFSPRVDPRGRTYYWLAGEAVEDFESGGDGPRDWPTDVAQIKANAPSLTPIQPELFWRGGLSSLPQLRIQQ